MDKLKGIFMKAPNKDWKENIAADEETRFNGYAEKIIAIQKKKTALYGNGRALHRKIIAGLNAKFEVYDNLPDYARQGLFAKKGTYDAWIRISNGGVDVKPDSIPDIRGFAIKVFGQNGPSALGNGNTNSQDFTLINQSAFSFPKSEPFIDLVVAATESPFALLKHLIGKHGIIGGIQKIGKTVKTFGKPFSGFMTETFYSAAPIACGEYASRVRLIPISHKPKANSNKQDFSVDIASILSTDTVEFNLQLQFFVDESITPIEDASIDWPENESPYITVAKLIIPSQNINSDSGKELKEKIEKSVFDPWNALLAHRPLGDVMRARKVIYYASQKERGVYS
jgi:hypothetical protein